MLTFIGVYITKAYRKSNNGWKMAMRKKETNTELGKQKKSKTLKKASAVADGEEEGDRNAED